MTVMTTMSKAPSEKESSLLRIKLAYQRIRVNIAENLAEEESAASTPVSTRGSSDASLSNASSIERTESELKEERTEKLLRIKTMYRAISKEADTQSWIDLMREQRDSAARSCRKEYEATPDFSNSVNLCQLAKDPQWRL